MLGRRERHRRRARGVGWPFNPATKLSAAVPAFLATGVLRQSAGPFQVASRAWQVVKLVEFATQGRGACFASVTNSQRHRPRGGAERSRVGADSTNAHSSVQSARNWDQLRRSETHGNAKEQLSGTPSHE
jgi:hypothetical protein